MLAWAIFRRDWTLRRRRTWLGPLAPAALLLAAWRLWPEAAPTLALCQAFAAAVQAPIRTLAHSRSGLGKAPFDWRAHAVASALMAAVDTALLCVVAGPEAWGLWALGLAVGWAWAPFTILVPEGGLHATAFLAGALAPASWWAPALWPLSWLSFRRAPEAAERAGA